MSAATAEAVGLRLAAALAAEICHELAGCGGDSDAGSSTTEHRLAPGVDPFVALAVALGDDGLRYQVAGQLGGTACDGAWRWVCVPGRWGVTVAGCDDGGHHVRLVVEWSAVRQGGAGATVRR